ncbi:MAG: response regulator [Actinomycetota bacterium]|nr:response regulator [Actinomycetota bacterium]
MVNPFTESRILLVDDSPDLVLILQRMLEREGYTELISTSDPRQVVDLYLAFRPDLVLLDLHMPEMNGLDVMASLKEATGGEYVPVVMLTGDQSPEAKLRALGGGAKDFLTKPFDRTEVHLRIKNLLEMRHLHQELRKQNELLEQKVAARTKELERAKEEILERLALAAEFRDDATGEHTQRVGQLCADMALVLGLPKSQIELIRAAAPLHDIGKIGVPDEILLKPDKLTHEEWEIMKGHTVTGARLLSKSVSPALRLGARLAFTHHERWDGQGYEGMSGETIPLSGRLVAVADAFDAMTHDRPYRRAMHVATAIAEIDDQRNRQFDSRVVDAFLHVYDDPEQTGARNRMRVS